MPGLLRHLWVFLLIGAPVLLAAPRPVMVYNTYDAPPFRQSDGGGLAAELVQLLNQRLGDRFQLELQHVPRQRLLKIHLDPPERFQGLALFLAPPFVGDDAQQLYLWSEPLFEDRNLLVLPRDRAPAEAPGLDWLNGKLMVSVRGQRYAVLDPLLAQGRLRRIEVADERSALKTLLAQADFTQMNQLMFYQLSGEMGLRQRLLGVPEPGSGSFQRRVLVGRGAPELLMPLNEAIATLPCEARWRELAALHGFVAGACKAASPRH